MKNNSIVVVMALGEGGGTKSTTTMAFSPSPSLRLLGLLERPEPDISSPTELNEADVLWSSSSSSDDTDSRFSSPLSISPGNHHFRRQPSGHLIRSKYGLSAALTDDSHHPPPLLRRKSTLSSTSAAKMIPSAIISENNSNLSSNKGGGRFHQSAPVNIPIWPKKKNSGEFGSLEQLDELDNEIDEKEEEEMVPPHVIVARSHVTFSVFEGVGRTLKGRDLRRVRNAVFQQTGFID